MVLSLVVWRRSEFLFLAEYSTDKQIGFYSIAFAATTALSMIAERLAVVVGSAFATLHGAAAVERLRSGFKRGAAAAGHPVAPDRRARRHGRA